MWGNTRTTTVWAALFFMAVTPPATQAEPNAPSDFAAEVISYTPGTGLPRDIITDELFDDPNAALGRPTVDTTGDDWYIVPVETPVPVVPVYGPFRSFEVVTIGNGGQLTVRFDHPVKNDPHNPYGADFIVFGNFVHKTSGGGPWTNGNPNHTTIGNPLQSEPGVVSVSQDGQTWFTFNTGPFADVFPPTLGRTYDPNNPDPNLGAWNQWWGVPTDPTKPLDPNVTSLAGKTVAQAALAYDGSAGGTPFDIGVLGLDWIRYVRIQNGPNSLLTAEIDALADVAAVYTLTVTRINVGTGTVLFDPAPADANQPAYREGTHVMLTAVPAEKRSFVQWEIEDPNHPGDGNYVIVDSNASTTIAMDADRVVVARFKCGSDLGPLPPLMLVLMTFRFLSNGRTSRAMK